MRLLRTHVPTGVVVAAGLAIVFAVVTIVAGRYVTVVRADRDAAQETAASVTVVLETLREQVAAAAAEAVAQGADAGTSADPPREVVAAAALARDTGTPTLEDVDGGVVVVAVYDTPAALDSVQARRDHVVGYLVRALDLSVVLGALAPDPGGIAVSGPDQPVASVPAERPRDASSSTVSLPDGATAGWSVTVWTTSPFTPGWVWLVAILYLVGGAVAAGWIGLRDRTARRREDELRGLQQTSTTVANLAIMAQHSLDLGEALPSVTSELASALDLRGLSLAAPSPDGDRPIFGWGAQPRDGTQPRGVDGVPAGQTVALPLSRGGRTVATLRVVSGRDLERHDLNTLVAAGDLLTSALMNAEAYSRQQDLVTRMQSVDELKSVFLATASHELRTPVVALTGYAGLLAAHWDTLSPTQARAYADRVDKNAQRLSRLVEDLLDFSRLERGQQVDGEVAELDLGAVVGHLLDEHELASDHVLSYETEPALLVRGARQAVERVVTNLVGNAAKYSPTGTHIQVTVRRAGDRAELVVDDEGPGIPAAEREQVFSRFYRGQGEAVVRTRGAGLGLAIVTEFAAAMGGEVRVDEAPSGGARFIVAYPLAEVSDSASQRGAAHDQT